MNPLMEAVVQAFRKARTHCRALEQFPGEVPATLAEAYEIQDREIALAERPRGWKVAAIRPDLREVLGAERLAGPIIHRAEAGENAGVGIAVIPGGFAAVEAEFVFVLKSDVARGASSDAVLATIGSVHAGVEVAGSPLATLSALGPTAVISDHGNNAAVVLGPELHDWQSQLSDLPTRISINGAVAGEGGAGRLPSGGPLGALTWVAEHLAERGFSLQAGDWIATGATTGVHPVKPGDAAVVSFGTTQFTINIEAAEAAMRG